MTMANLLMLAHPMLASIRAYVYADDSQIFIIHGGETCWLTGEAGDQVSVLPLHGHAVGITYIGLEYPLDGATLAYGSPSGVSNRMTSDRASIQIDEGLLLCFFTHQQKIDKDKDD